MSAHSLYKICENPQALSMVKSVPSCRRNSRWAYLQQHKYAFSISCGFQQPLLPCSGCQNLSRKLWILFNHSTFHAQSKSKIEGCLIRFYRHEVNRSGRSNRTITQAPLLRLTARTYLTRWPIGSFQMPDKFHARMQCERMFANRFSQCVLVFIFNEIKSDFCTRQLSFQPWILLPFTHRKRTNFPWFSMTHT